MQNGVTITGDYPALQRVLRAAQGKLAPRQINGVIGAQHHANIQDHFLKQQDGDGNAWAPVKREPGRGKTLQRSRRLMTSIGTNVTEQEAENGTNVVYAGVHEFGHTFPPMTIRAKRAKALAIPVGSGVIFRKSATLPSRTVPARSFLRPGRLDIAKIERAVDLRIRRLMERR